MEKINKKERKAVDRRTFLKVAGAAGAATLVGGFPYVVRAKPKEVLIGTIHPLSGGLAQAGNALKTGVVLAAEEINRAGGIKSLGGAKLKLIHADSEGKPQIGVAEAERLIKEGVLATFGCYQSSVTFAVTQIHEKYKTPFLITLAISEKILQRGFKYTFRVSCDSVISVREIIRARDRRSLSACRCAAFWTFICALTPVTPLFDATMTVLMSSSLAASRLALRVSSVYCSPPSSK